MKRVLSTTNYDQFTYMLGNRPAERNLNDLIAKIRRKNQLADYPILVNVLPSGKLQIADGQHRHGAAKALKLPLFYIETKGVTIEDVAQANSAQQKWTPNDYIHSFSALGNKNYITLKDFIREFGFPPSTSAMLLAGAFGHNGDSSTIGLKDGTFKVNCEPFARRVASALTSLHTFPSYKDRSFVIAICRAVETKQFSFARFVSKLDLQPTKLVKCASWLQYLELIEEIYNYRARSSEMIPLVIEAKKQLTK